MSMDVISVPLLRGIIQDQLVMYKADEIVLDAPYLQV